MGTALARTTLDEYLFEVFRIGADGLWVLHDMSDGALLSLASVGCEVAMSVVFAGVDAPQGED